MTETERKRVEHYRKTLFEIYYDFMIKINDAADFLAASFVCL